MTVLTRMEPAAFEAFAAEAIASYAEDNVLCGRWLDEGAQARAQAEFDRLLPQGMDTPDHEFFVIRASPDGDAIGALWFGVSEAWGERSGYLYSIRLKPEYRGRGHAAEALGLLDRHARTQRVDRLGLHVFALNTRALALYRAAGYGVTGYNLLKRLAPDGA